MSRQFWLLRHAEAVPHGTRSDPERELTERGEAQSVTAGLALRALGLTFTQVLSSTKVRAWETARLACQSLGNDVAEHQPLYGGFDGRQAFDLLHMTGADERLLVVGHNPDFAQTVYDLTGARVDFKKGGVAGIRIDGTRAELLVMLRPRELAAIAGRDLV